MKRVPLGERVLWRLQQLVEERGISHEKLAPHLGISPSAVSKLLSGKNAIGLNHLDGFSVALQITPAEILAEPHALIQALTPIEAAIVDIVRKMNELHRHSLLSVLDWQRGSSQPSKKGGRTPDHLTPEDAMVLSLYRGMEDADAQAGVVMQMRGYVQAKHEADTVSTRGRK